MSAYLDHAASTPLRPAALEAMMPWLTSEAGNPSGGHRAARAARRAIDDARDAVATLTGAEPGDVVFTSGGTEADNLAIFGLVGRGAGRGVGRDVGHGVGRDVAARGRRAFVAASVIEHHAVLEAVERVEGSLIDVDGRGRVRLEHLATLLDEHLERDEHGAAGGVVSVQLVNNEVGTVQPVDEVAELVHGRQAGIAVHTDAVQSVNWVDVAARTASADLVSLAAHKFGGPKGVGALVVRPGVALQAQLVGGGQERDRRSGTQNVAGIVGMGAAAAEVLATRKEMVERVDALRTRLLGGLAAAGTSGWRLTVAPGAEVVPGIVHLCFAGLESEALLFLADQHDVCVSGGSSCASGALGLSHVLAAMAVDPVWGGGALRLSLGWSSTEADVDHAVAVVAAAVAQLRR